jgi:hypothetical protein
MCSRWAIHAKVILVSIPKRKAILNFCRSPSDASPPFSSTRSVRSLPAPCERAEELAHLAGGGRNQHDVEFRCTRLADRTRRIHFSFWPGVGLTFRRGKVLRVRFGAGTRLRLGHPGQELGHDRRGGVWNLCALEAPAGQRAGVVPARLAGAFVGGFWPAQTMVAYYYIHTALPLCWCAGEGIGAALLWAWERRRIAPLTVLGIYGLVALAWMSARVWIEVQDMRASPQIYTELVLGQMKRFKPVTHRMYAQQEVYSFYADIPMVSDLAVMPLKRFWAGEMTNERLAAEVAQSAPEIIVLANDGRPVPFEGFLEHDYRLVYYDSVHRLYAHKSISRYRPR